MAEEHRATADGEHRAHWTREGFAGQHTTLLRPHATPEFVAVEGLHAPHRLAVAALRPPDRDDPAALPLVFMAARSGLQLSVSARQAPMPFVVVNVEADEVHFVQAGALRFETDHGALTAEAGELVCVPRAVQYRMVPERTPTLSVTVEVPEALAFAPVAAARLALERPALDGVVATDDAAAVDGVAAADGETVVLVKAFDGVTRYRRPHDPLAAVVLREGTPPVWKFHLGRNLAACGGPPEPFLLTASRDALFFNLSARPGRRRPPIHHNADYDELIYYVGGPGAYGRVTAPGTLTWVPKGIPHQGPSEDVPEGYVAWMVESRSTLRLTPAGLAAAELMELDGYGRHPAAAPALAARP
ncbi:MAG TPA: homogentisate 1,2-dioxygenase [Chloroflexota bacterium]